MSKNKKEFDNRGTAEDTTVFKEETKKVEDFEYTHNAFCAVWNETRKQYDMLTIRINSGSEEIKIERSQRKYDSLPRAMEETMRLTESEFLKKGRNR